MTETEAQKTIRQSARHIGGDISMRIVPYTCSGGFAVVIPVPSQPELYIRSR